MAHYEIDSANTVRIWFDENPEPSIAQPHHPDGSEWANRKAAEDWANATITQFQQAALDAEKLIKARESALEKLEAMGFTADEIAALVG